YLLEDSGVCVQACPDGKFAKDGKHCDPCDQNGVCRKTCTGTNGSDFLNAKNLHQFINSCTGTNGSDFLNAKNLHQFINCTIIDGTLRILKQSFLDDQYFQIRGLSPEDLRVLENVREITGFLLIQSEHENFTSLSFLQKLQVIHGRQLDGGQALHVLGTPLKSLELSSLKSIRNGNVYILANQQLCYANTVDWSTLFAHRQQKAQVGYNRSPDDCEKEGFVCDEQCADSGCWGAGPNQCVVCRNAEVLGEHLCLGNCSILPRLYQAGESQCRRCDSECANSCTGPENTDCDACKHVSLLGVNGKTACLSECPLSTYQDEYGDCLPCHPYCADLG
ncbi:hypothetical protein BaRGS_00040448, partial [Batillaria attramentaria]